METIRKEQLLLDFTNDKKVMLEILHNNRKVFDYIIKKDKTSRDTIYLIQKVIKDFIEETFYFDDSIKTKEELLELVKDYDLIEYIDSLVDIYDEDIVNSYIYFQEYVEKVEWDVDILEIIKVWQFNWYSRFYEDIKNEFIKFLEKC